MPRRPYWPIIITFAAVKFLLHLYASGSYGYFRDELYFIACGRHLDWGFVDHPPLVAVYARIGEWLGPSLRGFRFLGTVAGAVRILLTGVIAARLGGGRVAQALACTAVLFAPIYLAIDSILSMNGFEHLFWLAAILIAIEIANGASGRWWLAFGAVCGLGLQNKHSMVFLGFALVVAMLLTPMRRALAEKWIWLGGAVAALIFLPNLIWEVRHDFATLELLRNVKESGKNVVMPPLAFMKQQAMMLDPFSAPLWILGLGWLLLQRRYRFLGLTYLIVLIAFIRLEAKDYYVAPIYPLLFAAGGAGVEWLAARFARGVGDTTHRRRAVAVYAAFFFLVVVGGAIGLPLALPLFAPERYVAYQRALGIEPHKSEVSHVAAMPQIFADQFGWEEMVRKVARYYHSLPPEQRKRTAIYTGNYGEAGAIDFFGPKYGLPPAICGHQNYFLWGPRGYTGESVILIEDDAEPELWQSIREVDRRYHPYAIAEENGPIYHGVGLKVPLGEIWPKVKHWR